MKVRERKEGASCPLCREALASSPQQRECPGCNTTYHASCLSELGGCATLGCSARVERPRDSEGDRGRDEGVQISINELRGIRPRQREVEEPEDEALAAIGLAVAIFQGLVAVGLLWVASESLNSFPAFGIIFAVGGLFLLSFAASGISAWFRS